MRHSQNSYVACLKLRITLFSLFLNIIIIASIIPNQRAEAYFDISDLTQPHLSSTDENVVNCTTILCVGSNNDNIIIGSSLNEKILGLKGNDNIQGNDGNDIVFGGDGDDVISGGGSFDKLFGGDGDDVLIGDSTTSLLDSLVGDEVAAVNRYNEMLLGVNSAASSSSTSLAPEGINTNKSEYDKVKSLTTLSESHLDPNMIGGDIFALQAQINDLLSSNIQLLVGGKGDDRLLGSSADEFFIGGAGHDYFDCNEGIDVVLDFNPKEDTVNVNCEILE